MAPLTEFHASIADVTNDEHQNMDGLVQPDDFNAEVVVRFLRANESMRTLTRRPAAFVTWPPIQHVRPTCSSPACVYARQ